MYVRGFGGCGAQELAARRHIAKELTHAEDRARRCAMRLLVQDFAVRNFQARARILIRRPGGERYARNRCDAGKRLAPKAKRGDGVQVPRFGYLAGGKALKRKFHLVVGNAAAVVGDANMLHAAALRIHRNAGCAGVERILHKLLDHRRRTLYNLARGNHRRDMIRKQAYGHQTPPFAPFRGGRYAECSERPSAATSAIV